jgi:hypothetical protein
MGLTKSKSKSKNKSKTKKGFKEKSKTKTKSNRVFNNKHYSSGDGMLTTIWGPNMWHYLHTLSFNYPINPTLENKKYYKQFILNLQHTLPCKYCRINLKNNLKSHPLKSCYLKNRDSFSRYVYKLHEIVNKMLKKKSELSYCDVRERYEHFRSRCTNDKKTLNDQQKLFKFNKTKKAKEKGCTEPLYGKKAKCVINIVPQERKGKTLKIDNKCIKKRIT